MNAILLSLWEKSGLLTKLLIIWAIGPAFLVYLFLGWKDDFGHKIKADIREERVVIIKSIEKDIGEIKTDVRDLRNALIGPRKDK